MRINDTMVQMVSLAMEAMRRFFKLFTTWPFYYTDIHFDQINSSKRIILTFIGYRHMVYSEYFIHFCILCVFYVAHLYFL